ncbi:Aldehyde/histidinol dehydrogenase [Boeremia exigua]|uniref:Aldehyde/histidinol dehydrogenase n=1 Tax=Boeremia exigua TaxID=749465 RepID=UPI001E8E2387|nr:Aldehyde/histidinol dehydrogenase [Boeremia exigua]KAH6616459.1 Aldehyde/histidinol dehydrogenase [Boeremia exigua]
MGDLYSSRDDIDKAVRILRATFRSGRTKDLKYRKWQLKQLYWLVADNHEAIIDALHKDLGRPEFETRLNIKGMQDDIVYHIKHFERWARGETPKSGFIFSNVGRTHLRAEPRGLVFIIGPWNFPDTLTITPLAAAISAGCTALIKPSELAANFTDLFVKLAPKYLDSESYALVTGAASETQYMLSHKFDHIFFTGSTPVAKHVAAAAAKHLTPTVLELGGQCPAIVTKTANVDLAAKRIAAAKFMNAGQICLSVNHVFIDPKVHDDFINRLKHWNQSFTSNGESDAMCTIINDRNFGRLEGLLNKTQGNVVYGGSGHDRNLLKLKTTVVDNVGLGDSLLSEELFGPLLPIMEADSKQAVEMINNLPHPLGLYIFSHDQSEIDYVLDNTLSGGVTINDTLLHAGVPEVPFGGVGDSGMGAYHGKYGFDTFTHLRAVVQMPDWLDKFMGFRYPPYDLTKSNPMTTFSAPPFKRGETLQDQEDGISTVVQILGSAAVIGGLAIVLAGLQKLR